MMGYIIWYALTGLLAGFISGIVFLTLYRLIHNRRQKKPHGFGSIHQAIEFKADNKILDKGRNDESLSEWK